MQKFAVKTLVNLLQVPEVKKVILETIWPSLNRKLSRANKYTQARSETLPMKLKIEYEIFTTRRTSYIWGIMDLSYLGNGDQLDIKLYSPVVGKEQVVEHWVIEHAQRIPAYVITERLVPAGTRITVQQVTGIAREIAYDFYAR